MHRMWRERAPLHHGRKRCETTGFCGKAGCEVRPTPTEVLEWANKQLERERELLSGTQDQNSCGAGMSMGAIDVLERLKLWVEGEDE